MALGGAIHIHGSDHEIALEIDRWLDQHEVATTVCQGPYEACVTLLTRPELAPELGFVGPLTADEWVVLRYLRETWPHIGVVVYGQQDLPRVEPNVWTCRTQEEWQAMTSWSPAELVERMQRAPRTAPVQQLGPVPEGGSAPPESLSAEELAALLDQQRP